jgi:hypothetical protein
VSHTPSPRLQVDDQIKAKPVQAAAPAESPVPKAHRASAQHSVEGVSVRKKDDHFPMIIICMLVLSVLTFFAGYRFGQKKGVELAYHQLKPQHKIASHTTSSTSKTTATERTVRSNQNRPETGTGQPARNRGNGVELLPTQLKRLQPEQIKAAAPVTPPKIYTLQIQTFGRNQKSNIDDLILNLRQAGFDAFADYSDGAVFVGRLESSRGAESMRLKNEVSRFNWRKRDFGGSYFRRIPHHLLEK